MARKLSWFPTVVLMVCLTAPAHAVTVIVPTDYPTVQSALDAGAEVIQIARGVVPERITIDRSVTIEPASRSDIGYVEPIWAGTPLIQSVGIAPSVCAGVVENLDLVVRGVRFLGQVDIPYCSGSLVFEACRFDSGFVGPSTTFPSLKVSVRSCMILGDATLTSSYTQFVRNTVVGGSVTIWADGLHEIEDNLFLGPAPAALILSLDLSAGQVSRNTIRGFGDGIRFPARTGNGPIIRNEITDCSGNGIVAWSSPSWRYTLNCIENRIERCGGAGIAGICGDPFYQGRAGMVGNIIRDTGGDGARFENGLLLECRDNVVSHAAGHGVYAMLADRCEHNLISENQGDGIHLTQEPYRVVNNTIYRNGGAGIRCENVYAVDSIARNLLALNTGPGLQLDAVSAPPHLSCNDYFHNTGGATVGILPDASDLMVDPLFCDLNAGDVRLAANSPLLNSGGCGLIGGFGQGCGIIGTAAPAQPILEEVFDALPIPARGKLSFSIPASSGPSELEVFDVTGARRWQKAIPAGVRRAEWSGVSAGGGRLPPGVYFAQLRRSGVVVARTRVVLSP